YHTVFNAVIFKNTGHFAGQTGHLSPDRCFLLDNIPPFYGLYNETNSALHPRRLIHSPRCCG
ncbi:MAG: hypothetical protein J5I81_07360, partial [Nitrococcus mobilis]|nr:hypothetical protein [Nitrococcus mobilis]